MNRTTLKLAVHMNGSRSRPIHVPGGNSSHPPGYDENDPNKVPPNPEDLK